MTLPPITAPSSVPAFSVDQHELEQGNYYAEVQQGRGHGRKRRLYTAQQRKVMVSWMLSQAQMQAVDSWFENDLVVGSRPSLREWRPKGRGTVWYAAYWAAPYEANPVRTTVDVHWHVTGSLVLLGEPSTTPPVTGDLAAEISIPLIGTVVIQDETPLAAEVVMLLLPDTVLAAEILIDLDVGIPHTLLIGSGYRLGIGNGYHLQIGQGNA